MIIACDMDDVLVDFWPTLLAFYNERHQTDFCKEHFLSYSAWETWGGTREEAIEECYEFYKTDAFKMIAPINGAITAVRHLASAHELFVVTGRPHETAEATRESLDAHFLGLFGAVHHTNAFARIHAPLSKADICAEIEATVLIEDYLGHAIECANAGMRVILFDQPWNREPVVCGGLIERVYSWDEVLNLLL